jgi:chaperonin GroES
LQAHRPLPKSIAETGAEAWPAKLRRPSSASFQELKLSIGNRRNIMRFRPLHDRIVVQRISADEKTAGGIIIPDTAQEKPQQGEVISVGPGARNERGEIVPLDVKVGDTVLFGKWSGTEVKMDGQDFLIMKESDVMGIMESLASTVKKAA